MSDHLHDYQMSAFAMAVLIRGMSEDETVCLTKAMLDSGTKLQWPADKTVVSKHSTGGVGDKVSLVLVPLLAACGLNMPKISGRGLGTTGGTLDKLESLTGFRTNLSTKEITSAVDQVVSLAPPKTSLPPIRNSMRYETRLRRFLPRHWSSPAS